MDELGEQTQDTLEQEVRNMQQNETIFLQILFWICLSCQIRPQWRQPKLS